MTSPRRAAKYGPVEPVDADLPEWRRYRSDDPHWDHPDDADKDPTLRRVYRRRRWEAAQAEWGRANGYDPDAKYLEPEGKRWAEFRNGPPRLLPPAGSRRPTDT